MIFDVLLRFRSNPVALVGDIEKAFLNIEIHPQDRDCLRFLWFKDVNAKEPDIVVYRFNRVVFGCNSSPFLLNCTLQHHINKYKEIDPEFADKLVRSFFVDDLVTSCKDSQTAHDFFLKSKDRMKEGGFTLRKWKTNDSALAGIISQGEVKVITENEENSYVKETLGVAERSNGRAKVLGLTWDNQKDLLEFELCKLGKEINNTRCPTKRGILSILASLFDPLGLTSPVTITAKIIFQELCLEKLNWDDPLPKDKCLRWEAWLHDLLETKTIAVNRCLIDTKDGRCRGAVVRKSGNGRSERLTRPLQKLIPLEISAKEHERNTGVEVTRNVGANERKEKEWKEGSMKSDGGRRTGNRPVRAAAKDALWKSQLMLDP